MSRQTTRRGRPPLAWIDADALRGLPAGIAVTIELRGQHAERRIGRIVDASDHSITIAAGAITTELALAKIRRARILPAVFEPGDPVLRPGIEPDTWRAGVVRTEGTDVLVERIESAPDGTAVEGFAWVPESDLEPASARDQPLPRLPKGPVPARASAG